MKNPVIAQLAAATLVAFLTSVAPAAQVTKSGEIHGIVTDPSGAAIPGASVVISASHFVRTISTDEAGQYAFFGMAPGHYRVDVQSPGFSRFEKSDLVVSAGYETEADAQLNITDLKQEIKVTP